MKAYSLPPIYRFSKQNGNVRISYDFDLTQILEYREQHTEPVRHSVFTVPIYMET